MFGNPWDLSERGFANLKELLKRALFEWEKEIDVKNDPSIKWIVKIMEERIFLLCQKPSIHTNEFLKGIS